ncbi:hypothetical protein BDV27DRAFT_129726 [Aspergillus caelatus]|uniref:Uncharacterized protein n=1 Tax=Aspergillus caelatus TaxID=61420 RepID=A0A5N7A4W5_9EURO|nr:uncharacterized protein BDV27DRAFT_129726 [Aspergillus caelatus]KAE8363560.1 hypothetical protein BDV27DRAFT_129726 [Aspergillus caelatus]
MRRRLPQNLDHTTVRSSSSIWVSSNLMPSFQFASTHSLYLFLCPTLFSFFPPLFPCFPPFSLSKSDSDDCETTGNYRHWDKLWYGCSTHARITGSFLSHTLIEKLVDLSFAAHPIESYRNEIASFGSHEALGNYK